MGAGSVVSRRWPTIDLNVRTLSHHYLKLADRPDPTVNERVVAAGARLLSEQLPGVTDVIPGYTTLLVEFDPRLMSRARLEARVATLLAASHRADAISRTVGLSVVYDGPDLLDVAAATGLEPAEVVRRHASVRYRAYAGGFTPGFAYLGEVDPAIRVPRRQRPREHVPAGSVGIADGQTGIYPLASPGGWNLIGRAVEPVYDPAQARPALIEPGDLVTFAAVATAAPAGAPQPLELLPAEPVHPAFHVHAPGLFDLVVDAGRFLAGRFGFARGGPLDPISARIANGLVSNPPTAPALEINYAGPTLEVLRDCVVAFTGAGVRFQVDGEDAPPYVSTYLRRGQVLTFPPAAEGVRGYLAVAGGFESARFMGSASVDVRGLIGRPLRAGDILGLAQPRMPRTGFEFTPYRRYPRTLQLRLLPGPQYDAELMEALTVRPVRVEHSDRMGVRLGAVGVAGGGVPSEGNPLGAVQLTPGGDPIVLLNDRGTMGGYIKPALVDPRDLPRLAQARDGTLVRFLAPKRSPSSRG